MIQGIHKGIEIEVEPHQFQHGWKADFTLVTHPDRTKTLFRREDDFPTMDLAVTAAMTAARAKIDQQTARRDTEIHLVG
jgi:hypothetical protein